MSVLYITTLALDLCSALRISNQTEKQLKKTILHFHIG